jgi:hypothetical protein
MQWVFYIGGRLRQGKLVTIKIGVSADPSGHLAALAPTQPYDLELIGLEVGGADLLAQRQKEFRALALRNDWYRPDAKLVDFIQGLPQVDLGKGAAKKVCVDFTPEEFALLEAGVETIGTITKARLIRRAVTFYLKLGELRARGYLLQAMRGGKFTAFPDLDDIRDPDL